MNSGERSVTDPCGSARFFVFFLQRLDPVAEEHVVAEPHREIGSPDVVVEVEMNSPLQIRLFIVEVQEGRLARRDKRRIFVSKAGENSCRHSSGAGSESRIA